MSDTTSTDNAPENAGNGPENAEKGEATLESLQAELEALKGESRKWEGRAKANSAAAKELDALRKAAMTDEERRTAELAEKDATLAEALKRADEAEAALKRAEIVVEFALSKEDAEVLSGVTDEATLRALAERLSGRSSDQKGPKPNPAQGRKATGTLTPRDAGIEALGALFGD